MPPVERRLEFTVPPDDAGTRLDRCLSRLIAGLVVVRHGG